MASDLRGVYLIGDKLHKVVTAVLVQDPITGDTSTLPLEQYVHHGLEPPDGLLPWEEDVEMKPATPKPTRGLGFESPTIGSDPWMMRVRNLPLQSESTDPIPPPPVETARTVSPPPVAVTVPTMPSAGTAPHHIESTLSGAGDMTVEARVKSARRTTIGRALVSNREPIILNVQALLLLLEHEIDSLDRANSDEGRAELDQYLHIKQGLERIRNSAQEIEIIPEDVAVETTKSFGQGIRSWWDKCHIEICNSSFKAGLFLGCLGVCNLCGDDVAIAISGAIVGGKAVADALTSAAKLIRDKVQK
jgi:hypothetical protein